MSHSLECWSALILVVDDDVLLRQVLQDALELEGHQVVTAADAHKGLAYLDNASVLPNLILSDVRMKPLDGCQFLDAVRARDDCHDMPFIFLTGLDERDAACVPSHPLVVYLTKPIRIPDLVATIEGMLRQARAGI